MKNKFTKRYKCNHFSFIHYKSVKEIVEKAKGIRPFESIDKDLICVVVISSNSNKPIEILVKNTKENLKLLKSCSYRDNENGNQPTMLDFEEVEVRYFVYWGMYRQYYVANKLKIINSPKKK